MNKRVLISIAVLSLAMVFPLGCGMGRGGETQGPEASLTNHIDPVCQMSVNETDAKYITEHETKKYYFCSENCKESFEKEPAKYLKQN